VPRGQEELLSTAAAQLVADVLERFGEARIRVTGGSMYPSLRPGDVVTVRRSAADEVAAGDVVLVRDGERLIAHRLVQMLKGNQPQLVLRGDSHWKNDPPRPAASVIGRIVAVTRGGAEMAAPPALSRANRVRGLLFDRWTRAWRAAAFVAAKIAPIRQNRTPNPTPARFVFRPSPDVNTRPKRY
jgi:signal peptidase I